MNILMLSSTFPYPPTRGGTQVRTFNLIKYLQQHHAVTLVTQRSQDIKETEIKGMEEWVDELVVFPRPLKTTLKPGVLGKLHRFGNFLQQGIPPGVLTCYSPEMQTWIDHQIEAGRFEAITCEHSVNEIYVRPEFQTCLRKTVVNIHSSIYGSCRNQLQTGTAEKPFRDRLNLPLLRRYEQQYCKKFSDLVVTTDEDQHQMKQLSADSQIHVIPNGVDLEQFPYRPADPGGYGLIFIGAMDNLANIDAAIFLSQEIFPSLRRRYPDATLMLVGARPTAKILALGNSPGITVTGRVPSMAKYLHEATVCVVPMRTGYGIKNKTLEAMATGIPIVASDRGLEGLTVDEPGGPLRALRANRPEEFTEAIGRLFDNPDLRLELSGNERALIEQDYTWERAGQQYEQVLSL